MASEERNDDDRESAAVPPECCRITLIAFVPFVVDGWGGGTEDPDLRPDIPALGDLRLWPYSDALRSRLRTRLPHRVGRVGAPGLGKPGPCDRPPLVDVWSFGIGHSTFVETPDPGAAGTWGGLRDAISEQWPRGTFVEAAVPLTAALPDARVGPPLWAQRMLLVEVPPLPS